MGILLLSISFTISILANSVLLYFIIGGLVTPFTLTKPNFLLFVWVFAIVTVGCGIVLIYDSIKHRQKSNMMHGSWFIFAASLICGIITSLFFNVTIHTLVFFSRSINFPCALLIATLGLFVIASFLCWIGVAAFKYFWPTKPPQSQTPK